MKKLLAIALTILMVLSTVAVALPASAADEVVVGGEGTLKAEPVAADFDYEAKFPEADGWVAVTSPEDFKNNPGKEKYYLKNDIVLSAETLTWGLDTKEGCLDTKWYNDATILFDGCGHTIKYEGVGTPIFLGGGGSSNATVENVNFTGNVTVSSKLEVHWGSVVMHGFAGGLTMKNVHSDAVITVPADDYSVGGCFGGLIGKTHGANNFTNVSFTGSLNVGKGQHTNSGYPSFGALSGHFDGSTMQLKDCTINATIKSENTVSQNDKGAKNYWVGGVTGIAMGRVVVKQSNIKVTIETLGDGEKQIGGVVGYAKSNDVTVENSIVDATITDAVAGKDNVGGVVGYGGANVNLSNSQLKSNITVTGADTETYVGGIVGYNNAEIYPEGVTAEYTVNAAGASSCGFAGFAQHVYVDKNNETQHYKECILDLCCDNGQLDAEDHKGGEASCTAKAKCEVCGAEYGELKAHTYENGKCKDCGADEPAKGTDAPAADGDTPAATDAPAADKKDEGGCGSAITATAVVLTAVLALGAGVSFKKKED